MIRPTHYSPRHKWLPVYNTYGCLLELDNESFRRVLRSYWTNYIECVKQYKLLGVNLDNNLKWSFHVDNIHKKLTNKVLLLRRIKPYRTLEMRKLYYNSYILPIIDYGIILWQFAPKRKLIKIANIHKWTARMILDKSYEQFICVCSYDLR